MVEWLLHTLQETQQITNIMLLYASRMFHHLPEMRKQRNAAAALRQCMHELKPLAGVTPGRHVQC